MTGTSGRAADAPGLPASCRRVLVTGAEGFVGQHLIRLLAGAAPDALVLRAGRTRESDVAMDLSDPASVAAAISTARPDAVFHLAGEASVAGASAAAAQTWRVNLSGTLALAEALGQVSPATTLLFASSAEVYGRAFLDGRASEATCPSPMSVYGHSKLATEHMLADVLPTSASLIVARPTNHIGAGQSIRFVVPAFAAQLAEAERAAAPASIRVGNLEAERDFMDVGDVVRAYVALVARLHGGGARETINIASGQVRPIRAILDTLRATARVDSDVTVDPARFRAADIPRAEVDAAHLRDLIGWTPSGTLDASIAAVLDDWRTRAAAGDGGGLA